LLAPTHGCYLRVEIFLLPIIEKEKRFCIGTELVAGLLAAAAAAGAQTACKLNTILLILPGGY